MQSGETMLKPVKPPRGILVLSVQTRILCSCEGTTGITIRIVFVFAIFVVKPSLNGSHLERRYLESKDGTEVGD